MLLPYVIGAMAVPLVVAYICYTVLWRRDRAWLVDRGAEAMTTTTPDWGVFWAIVAFIMLAPVVILGITHVLTIWDLRCTTAAACARAIARRDFPALCVACQVEQRRLGAQAESAETVSRRQPRARTDQGTR
jgi:hypothetical protein